MRYRTLGVAAIVSAALAVMGPAAVAQEDVAPDFAQLTIELEANERIWLSTRPTAYTYGLERICFCPAEWRGPVRIEVDGLEVSGRTYVETGGAVGEPMAESFPAVEGLFDIIRDGIEREAHALDVTYDPDDGVPTNAWIDYDVRIADEEFGFAVTEAVMATEPADGGEGGQAGQGDLALPPRDGAAPAVTDGIPHIQLDQTSDDAAYAALVERAFTDPRVTREPSRASLPGALALTVAEGLPLDPASIIVGREFAHIHAEPGAGSMHLRLPVDEARHVIESGWGVWHPFAVDGTLPGLVMVWAPRTDADVEVIGRIIDAAIANATATDGA